MEKPNKALHKNCQTRRFALNFTGGKIELD